MYHSPWLWGGAAGRHSRQPQACPELAALPWGARGGARGFEHPGPAAPAEAAHRAATCCHLGGIASATGKEIQFDPETETITNSDKANGLLKREMRGDWQLT